MERRIQILGIFLSLLIFIISYFSPEQYHLEFLYSLIVLLTIWIRGTRSTFDASVALTGLIMIGFFLNKSFQSTENIVSLFLPLLFTWAFTFSIIKFKNSQENLGKSTEYLNAMFKHATEGIIITNQKGIIIMANPRSAAQFGYDENELKGKTVEELIPQKYAHRHTSHRKDYFNSPNNRPMGKGMNLFAKRSDGTEFPVEISLSSFKIKDERFVISFIIDITERKRQETLVAEANEQLEARVILRTQELAMANTHLQNEMKERATMQEALRDSERLYSAIARNFPNGVICVINKNLEIVFIDGKELEVFDLKPDELTGKPLQSLLPGTEARSVADHLGKVFSWESLSFELQLKNKHYNLFAVPLPDMKGYVKDILLVIQNVTEQKKAANEILSALEKEKTLNELKSKFVSIASHEFRTPLSTILSSVTLISKYQNPEDADKRNKHIERIKNSVKNLTEILNDFLSLEKLEAGKIEAHPGNFDLIQFSEELREELQALSKKGQKIQYKHEGTGREAYLDKQLLRHICINLLNNAIKYSPEDSTIDFMTRVNGNIEVIVRDRGMGIPAEDQEHLFERFFRAANVTAIQGTGLGLNIVRRYVQILNGNINFESRVNEGSTFTIRFPKAENKL
jgi:PAS domain S-box-containing protein